MLCIFSSTINIAVYVDGALELDSTQPYSVALTQQYTLGQYVPGTVVGPENRAVSKTVLVLDLMGL